MKFGTPNFGKHAIACGFVVCAIDKPSKSKSKSNRRKFIKSIGLGILGKKRIRIEISFYLITFETRTKANGPKVQESSISAKGNNISVIHHFVQMTPTR